MLPPVTMSMQVKGAQDFARLARHLKDVGAKKLRQQLYRGVNRAAKPAKPIVVQGARDRLPKRGGYNELVAGEVGVTVGKKSAGKKVGVSIVARPGRRSKRDLRSLEQGTLRWPVFPRPRTPRDDWRWKTRPIDPEWFSEPLRRKLPPGTRREILNVIDEVQNEIDRVLS